ncbi:uncharacterized protein LOC135846245 [Planococcus citri]|uniref:uncharacterized protein LOC135846245 n=1 Tax=Planococcus citri TaxID=170843 RepID=UPI0031F78FB2
MNFARVSLVALCCVVFFLQYVSCQFEFPSLFSEFPEDTLRPARDPRQDRGPVQFPSAPIGPETSGVRVGASGFGFVPPGGRGRAIGAIGGGGGGPNAFQEFTFW